MLQDSFNFLFLLIFIHFIFVSKRECVIGRVLYVYTQKEIILFICFKFLHDLRTDIYEYMNFTKGCCDNNKYICEYNSNFGWRMFDDHRIDENYINNG